MSDHLENLIDQLDKQIGNKFTAIDDEIRGLKQKGVSGGLIGGTTQRKTLASALIGDEGFARFKSGDSKFVRASLSVKSTIIGEGGTPQNPVDTIAAYDAWPGIAGGAFRTLSFLDTIPRATASSNQVHYTRESAWTNGAAETAEGGTKPSLTITFDAVDEPVRTIAHVMKASKQILDDAPALEAYLNTRMAHGVRQRLEAQILNGNGTSPNLQGIFATGRHVDLAVSTGETDADAANRAKYAVVAADYQPTAFVLNPADWSRMERVKTGISGDKSYAYGEGSAASYLQSGMGAQMWGLPVVTSNSCPAGQFACYSRDALMLWMREEVGVELFEQNEDDVVKNLCTFRAEARAAFGVFQPAAVIVGAWPNAE